ALVVAVDLGGRGHEDPLPKAAAEVQDDLGAADVGHKCPHRLFHDQADADRGGKVPDAIASVDEAVDHRLVGDRIDYEMEVRPVDQIGDVVQSSGGQVIERVDLEVHRQERLAKMRPEEPCSASDQRACTHVASPPSNRARDYSTPGRSPPTPVPETAAGKRIGPSG